MVRMIGESNNRMTRQIGPSMGNLRAKKAPRLESRGAWRLELTISLPLAATSQLLGLHAAESEQHQQHCRGARGTTWCVGSTAGRIFTAAVDAFAVDASLTACTVRVHRAGGICGGAFTVDT